MIITAYSSQLRFRNTNQGKSIPLSAASLNLVRLGVISVTVPHPDIDFF